MRAVRTLSIAALVACSGTSTDDTAVDTDTVDTDTAVDRPFPELDPSACAVDGAEDALGFDASATFPSSGDLLADRLFPLLSMLDGLPEVTAAVAGDTPLGDQSAAMQAALAVAADCDGDFACVRAQLVLGEQDGFDVGTHLASLLGSSRGVLVPLMKETGLFFRWSEDAPGTLVNESWQLTWAGLVGAFDRFAGAVDAPTLDGLVDDAAAAAGADTAVWAPLAAVTIGAMHALGRDEAARYEPLAAGENAAAVARIAEMDWSAYRFAVILVPGQGPTDDQTALNPAGAARCDLAVARWEAGLAPFLLTSGGHVHPDATPYSEAIEMKRYLMETHGVPEDAILVDPYARHTTTNLRNLARTMLHLGMPAGMAALVTSDEIQSAYIAELLEPRCRRELGYVPWRSVVSLTPNDGCVRVSHQSLFVDPGDALDP
ncbi:MAG: YdcF family protein [Alphaproteobacteria bacterium]|nr:YdcF family protein [Alphaproteobacteria bacterium]